jgi:general stress protein 26
VELRRTAQALISDMSQTDNIDRVWDIIEKVGVCMLTSQFGGGLRARPIEARPDRKAGLIFFVTDIHSAKEDEIEARRDVGLVFIDSSDNAYLSITGRASVTRDPDKTKAAWRNTHKVWWPGGPTDPDVCLLQIESATAELWDGPASRVVTAFEFVKARLTGAEPNLGENRKVTVKM